jgi:hypothetical protein
MQWRNRYEQCLPPEEHEKNVALAMEVIPAAVDSEPAPVDERVVCNEVRSRVKRRRERENTQAYKIRLRDEHVLKALKNLVGTSGSGPMGVVVVKGDTPKTPKYWTRHRDASERATSAQEVTPASDT